MSKAKFIKLFIIGAAIAVMFTLGLTAVAAAADYYWVAGTGQTSDNQSWASSSGGAGGAGVPTPTDNVYFDANSFSSPGQVVAVDSSFSFNDMDWTGATNNPTLLLNASLSFYGDVTLVPGMTISKGGGTTYFNGKGTSVITSNGVTITSSFFGVGGYGCTVSQADDLNVSGAIQFFGTWNTNNNNVTSSGPWAASGNQAILSANNSVITAGGWSYTGSGGSILPNTATLNITGSSYFSGGNLDYNGLSINFNGTSHTVSGSFTCANLTRTGTATKTDSITFASGNTITVTDTATFNGNSETNRLLIQSSTVGSAATINATTLTAANADFMDITATNAVDLSAISGLSGDCGGNTNITFTSSTSQEWLGGSGSWSNANWTSHMPLPQDSATINTTGGTIAIDEPRIGANVTITGTGSISQSHAISVYGSLTISSGVSRSGNYYISFRGRDSYELTTNGVSLYGFYLYAPGGSLTLGSDLTLTDITSNPQINNGTFYTDIYNLNSRGITSSGATTRGVNLGSGTHTFTSTYGTLGFTDITNLTWDAGTSTIRLIYTGGSGNCVFGDLDYNIVEITGTASTITNSGNPSFNNLYLNASSNPLDIKVSAGSTFTLTDLTRDCWGTNTITINSTSTTPFSINFTDPSTPVWEDYLTIDYCNILQAGVMYAGSHSSVTNSSNVTASDPNLTVTNTGTSNLSMDHEGIITGNFTANTTPLKGKPYITSRVEYGTTPSFGDNTTPAQVCSYNQVFTAIPSDLTPGETYYWTANHTNNAGSFTGTTENFTLTMPTPVTVQAVNNYIGGGNTDLTFYGNITDLGVASSVDYYWEWGSVNSSLTHTTPVHVATNTGTVHYNLIHTEAFPEIFYRLVVEVGNVTAAGSIMDVNGEGEAQLYVLIIGLIPTILLCAFLGIMGHGLFDRSMPSDRKMKMLAFTVGGTFLLGILQVIVITLLPMSW